MNQRGMTLVEILVVMVLASVVGMFVMSLFVTSNRTFMDQNKILDAQRDGRLAMEFIAQALREAGLNPLNSPSFNGVGGIIPVLPVDPSAPDAIRSIWFDRDSDLDGVLDFGENILLEFNSGIIKRTFRDENGTPVWSQDIAKNVTSLQLKSFDASGVSSPANVDDIRWFELSVSFKDTKYRGGDFTRTYSTRVDLRNP